MVGCFLRWAMAAVSCALLAGCAGVPESPSSRHVTVIVPSTPISCVPYARAHSGVDIHGDAFTWWDRAAGHYRRSGAPSPGAVVVLAGYAGSDRAHVAVVRRIVSPREIRIDHANWLGDGAVHLDDPVADISPRNDWSQVEVWNLQSNSWGIHTYSVQGFIGPGKDDAMRLSAATGQAEDR